MSCACIKKHYDIHISYKDCKTLVYEDQSEWMDGESYEDRPDTYEVSVYIPSKKKEYTLTLDPSKRNYITSVDLFGSTSPTCLPDDIYCFSVTSCGEKYKINRAFICRSECKIDELTSKAKTTEDFKQLSFFRGLLEAVKSNAKLGKSETSKELLQVVTKKLKHLTCANC